MIKSLLIKGDANTVHHNIRFHFLVPLGHHAHQSLTFTIPRQFDSYPHLKPELHHLIRCLALQTFIDNGCLALQTFIDNGLYIYIYTYLFLGISELIFFSFTISECM